MTRTKLASAIFNADYIPVLAKVDSKLYGIAIVTVDGGGIVAVVPGRYAIGTFSPPLDEAGNSVRGQRAIASIVEGLGGNVFMANAKGAQVARASVH